MKTFVFVQSCSRRISSIQMRHLSLVAVRENKDVQNAEWMNQKP